MPRVAFMGGLSWSFADRVRAHLTGPCDFVLADEKSASDVLLDVEVLVTIAFSREMGAAAPRLRLIQVPGAGLDRIDRSAIPPGVALAKADGHETGIAEYVIGAMIALTRDFVSGRLEPSGGPLGKPVGAGRAAASRMARARRPDPRLSWAMAASARPSPGGPARST